MRSIREIAEICHAANLGLQAVNGDSQPSDPWWCLPAETQMVVMQGVERALKGATPAELHLSWMVSMQERGWRHGPVKDPQKRTHPNLVPYSELPQAERDKDSLFRAIVEWAKNT